MYFVMLSDIWVTVVFYNVFELRVLKQLLDRCNALASSRIITIEFGGQQFYGGKLNRSIKLHVTQEYRGYSCEFPEDV
jgi:hypothetical protein